MKLKIVGDAIVATSALKLASIERMAKVSPEALTLFSRDEETGAKVPEFRIATGGRELSLSDRGVTFTGKDAGGFATGTMLLPKFKTDAERKQYVADTFAKGIIRMNQLEAKFAQDVASVDEMYDQAMGCVDYVDAVVADEKVADEKVADEKAAE